MPHLPNFLSRLSPSSTSATAATSGDTPVAPSQGPATQAVREAQRSGEFETARRCVGADWWPRGLGLHVDDAELRHEFEPPEGARTWLQVERRPKGWSSEGTESTQLNGFAALTHGTAFARNLLQELRMHVGSLDPGGLRRLPRSGKELEEGVFDHEPVAGTAPRTRTIARPTPGRLTAGEALSGRVPIDLAAYGRGGSNSSEVVAIEGGRDGKTTLQRQAGGLFKGGASERAAAAIQAETAQRLGAVLLQRFDWTRPITLEPEPFKALAQALAQPSLTGRSWSLRAMSDRGDVQLVLHGLTGERSLGTVLKAGAHAQGVAIFRPRPDDNLACAAQQLAMRHNGSARLDDRFMLPASMSTARFGQRLAALDRDGRMIVHGHGAMEQNNGKVVAVGGKSAGQLAKELIAEGLPKDFKGTIFLDACGSLADAAGADGYAVRLRAELAAKGFDGVSVATRPGVMWGVHGRARTLPEGVPPLAEHFGDAAPEQAAVQELKLPRHRRFLNQLKSFFGFGQGPRVDDGTVKSTDPSGARHMWGHHGPSTPTTIRDPRASDPPPR